MWDLIIFYDYRIISCVGVALMSKFQYKIVYGLQSFEKIIVFLTKEIATQLDSSNVVDQVVYKAFDIYQRYILKKNRLQILLSSSIR